MKRCRKAVACAVSVLLPILEPGLGGGSAFAQTVTAAAAAGASGVSAAAGAAVTGARISAVPLPSLQPQLSLQTSLTPNGAAPSAAPALPAAPVASLRPAAPAAAAAAIPVLSAPLEAPQAATTATGRSIPAKVAAWVPFRLSAIRKSADRRNLFERSALDSDPGAAADEGVGVPEDSGRAAPLSLSRAEHAEHGRRAGPAASDAPAKSARQARALKTVIGIGALVLVLEYIGGVIVGSVALQANAMHMAADIAVSAAALAANWMARHPDLARKFVSARKLESAVALASSAMILYTAAEIGIEAFARLGAAAAAGGLSTILLAALGMAANVVMSVILYRHHGESLSIKGAFLHAFSDVLGSLGIIVGTVLMMAFGWAWADPVISLLIIALILRTTWELVSRAWPGLRAPPSGG